MLLSPPPVSIADIHADRVLIATGAVDIPRLRTFVPIVADIGGSNVESVELLNVSYDPTRALWKDLNQRFIPRYEKEAGVELKINQSHGGSTTQASASRR